MTVLSKLHCYVFESHGGLFLEFYHNDRQQTVLFHPKFTMYLTLGYWKTCNSTGLHTFTHAFPRIYPSGKSQPKPIHIF